jgi:hypothetical protein
MLVDRLEVTMTPFSAALRRASSITMAVAFVALAASGLLMLFVDRLEVQLRMHPVHNVFGLIMVVAGGVHVAFNWKALDVHLRRRSALVMGIVLTGVMVLLLVEGLTRPLDAEGLGKVEAALSAVHGATHGP